MNRAVLKTPASSTSPYQPPPSLVQLGKLRAALLDQEGGLPIRRRLPACTTHSPAITVFSGKTLWDWQSLIL
jgi:hypothetical protein